LHPPIDNFAAQPASASILDRRTENEATSQEPP